MARTPIWPIRLDPALRLAAAEKAALEGRTLAEVVREFLEEYVKP